MEYKKRHLSSWALRSAPKAKKHSHGKPSAPAVKPTKKANAKPVPHGHKLRGQWHFAALTTFSLLGIMFMLWVLNGVYLSRFDLNNHIISGRISNQKLQQLVSGQVQHHRITLTYPDNSKKSFALSDLGIKPDAALTVATLRQKQEGLGARLRWWQPISVPFQLDIKGSDLHAFIAKNVLLTIQPAKDATLTLESGQVKIIDSVAGKQYGLKDPTTTLWGAARSLSTTPLRLQTLSVTPAVTAEQLASSKGRLESTLSQRIAFVIDNRTITPSASEIGSWLELTPNDKNKTVDIAVSSGKVVEYINKIAAAEIHPPRAEVVITHSDGSKAVLVPGVNGIDVTNKQQVATQVADKLLDAKGMEIKLPINYAPYTTITAGNYQKWIEVDTTNKRMYAYEGSSLTRSFLISAGTPSRPTVTGQFAIYSKYPQQTMSGFNNNGSRYHIPNVPWVNYFYKDYAIHGNFWSPLSYFGNINSSHGCVGITVSESQWMYDWAPIGTPVIVHR